MFEECVERRHDRRQCAKPLDEFGAGGFRFGIVDGLSVIVEHGDRARRTRVVGKDPHLARGKGALQIVDHIFARSEEHTSELQSLMRISYAVFCLKKKKEKKKN